MELVNDLTSKNFYFGNFKFNLFKTLKNRGFDFIIGLQITKNFKHNLQQFCQLK